MEGQTASSSAAPERHPDPATARVRPSLPGRALEWFWRGHTLAELRNQPAPSPDVAVLEERATLAVRLARGWQRPDAPFENGSAEPLAVDLYGQAICWAGEGLRCMGAASGEPAAESERTFSELAELDTKALAELGKYRRGLARARVERATRTGVLVVLLAAILAGGVASYAWAANRKDLALGSRWSASSRFGNFGCVSPEQACEGSPHFFFHTNEERDPWLEIDLGAPKQFSSVEIENRRDCCRERAVPLVVEVSRDGKKWNEVARRDEEFSDWTASLDTTRARWVRVRIKGTGTLHLSRVRVLP